MYCTRVVHQSETRALVARSTPATCSTCDAMLLPVEELRSRDTPVTRWRPPVPWRHRSTTRRRSLLALCQHTPSLPSVQVVYLALRAANTLLPPRLFVTAPSTNDNQLILTTFGTRPTHLSRVLIARMLRSEAKSLSIVSNDWHCIVTDDQTISRHLSQYELKPCRTRLKVGRYVSRWYTPYRH